VIKYYSEFPCKVYICDSSKKKADVESCGTIIYRWVPQSNFYGKVLDVLNETSADFYALSPDDDFLKQETLKECYEVLKENEDYSFGAGRQVLFKEGFKEGFYTIESTNKLQGINEISFESREAYIKYFWEHYQNILWSIFRKDVIKAAFICLLECNFCNGNFVEMTLGIEGMRRGKVYLSSNGLNYREIIDLDHWGDQTAPISLGNINNPELHTDIMRFEDYYKDDGGFALWCINNYLHANETLWRRGKVFLNKLFPETVLMLYRAIRHSKGSKLENYYEDDSMRSLIGNAIELTK
jgi:glycosyltransferase domain-containing protein